MRSSLQLAAAAAAVAQVALAFPMMEMMDQPLRAERRANVGISGNGVPDPSTVLGFNAKQQYVSNQGSHKFVAPGPGDQRGPCPGLNAMANHGYIPHNGVATVAQFTKGCYDVFGMGLDLGGFLSVLGASIDGDLLSWSIGGPSLAVPLGDGITGSHNKYESDVSPTRPDLYEYGNNYKVRMEQWKQLYAYQSKVPNEKSNYNLAILEDFRSKRFDQSVQNNPYFFNGPFSGVAVQPAAYTFIYRFMANKSAEHPEGQLTRDVLKSFFGITEHSDGSFSGGEGQERIPDNWYKRPIGGEYTIPFFILDLNQEAVDHPKFFAIGGNTGKPNSFTGVNLEDLSGGVYNSKNLLQGNNLFCLAYQFATQGNADILTNLLKKLSGDAYKAIVGLGCPQLLKKNEDLLKKFPGYTKSG